MSGYRERNSGYNDDPANQPLPAAVDYSDASNAPYEPPGLPAADLATYAAYQQPQGYQEPGTGYSDDPSAAAPGYADEWGGNDPGQDVSAPSWSSGFQQPTWGDELGYTPAPAQPSYASTDYQGPGQEHYGDVQRHADTPYGGVDWDPNARGLGDETVDYLGGFAPNGGVYYGEETVQQGRDLAATLNDPREYRNHQYTQGAQQWQDQAFAQSSFENAQRQAPNNAVNQAYDQALPAIQQGRQDDWVQQQRYIAAANEPYRGVNPWDNPEVFGGQPSGVATARTRQATQQFDQYLTQVQAGKYQFIDQLAPEQQALMYELAHARSPQEIETVRNRWMLQQDPQSQGWAQTPTAVGPQGLGISPMASVIPAVNAAMELPQPIIAKIDEVLRQVPGVAGGSDAFYDRVTKLWRSDASEIDPAAKGPLMAYFASLGLSARALTEIGLGLTDAVFPAAGDPRAGQIRPQDITQAREYGKQVALEHPDAAWAFEQIWNVLLFEAGGKAAHPVTEPIRGAVGRGVGALDNRLGITDRFAPPEPTRASGPQGGWNGTTVDPVGRSAGPVRGSGVDPFVAGPVSPGRVDLVPSERSALAAGLEQRPVASARAPGVTRFDDAADFAGGPSSVVAPRDLPVAPEVPVRPSVPPGRSEPPVVAPVDPQSVAAPQRPRPEMATPPTETFHGDLADLLDDIDRNPEYGPSGRRVLKVAERQPIKDLAGEYANLVAVDPAQARVLGDQLPPALKRDLDLILHDHGLIEGLPERVDDRFAAQSKVPERPDYQLVRDGGSNGQWVERYRQGREPASLSDSASLALRAGSDARRQMFQDRLNGETVRPKAQVLDTPRSRIAARRAANDGRPVTPTDSPYGRRAARYEDPTTETAYAPQQAHAGADRAYELAFGPEGRDHAATLPPREKIVALQQAHAEALGKLEAYGPRKQVARLNELERWAPSGKDAEGTPTGWKLAGGALKNVQDELAGLARGTKEFGAAKRREAQIRTEIGTLKRDLGKGKQAAKDTYRQLAYDEAALRDQVGYESGQRWRSEQHDWVPDEFSAKSGAYEPQPASALDDFAEDVNIGTTTSDQGFAPGLRGLSEGAKTYLKQNVGNFAVAGTGTGATFDEDDDTQTKLLKLLGVATLAGGLGGGLYLRGKYKRALEADKLYRLPGVTQTPVGKKFWRLDTQRGDVAAISGEALRNTVATTGLHVGPTDFTNPVEVRARAKTIKELTSYVQTGTFTDMLASMTETTKVADAQVHNVFRLVGQDLIKDLPRIVDVKVPTGASPEFIFQAEATARINGYLEQHIGKSIRGPLVAGPEAIKRLTSPFLLKLNPRWGLENVRDRIITQGTDRALGQVGMQKVGKDRAAMVKALKTDETGAFGPLWLEAEIADDLGAKQGIDRYNPLLKVVEKNEVVGKQGIFASQLDNYVTTAWARDLDLFDRPAYITQALKALDTQNPFPGQGTPRLKGLPEQVRKDLLGAKSLQEVRDTLNGHSITAKTRDEALSIFNSHQRDGRVYANSATTSAMRNYAMKSNLDIAMQVVYPYHYWTTHGIAHTARIAGRYPAAGFAIAAATLYTMHENKDLPWYQRATLRVPTRAMIDHAPLPQALKDHAHEALNWYLDDDTGKKDLRIGFLNWQQPAMTKALLALNSPEKDAMLKGLDPQTMALFAEQFMGWAGRSVAWTGSEALVGNHREDFPTWLTPYLPTAPKQNPSLLGGVGRVARAGAEVVGKGQVPRAVNQTLYGKEFSTGEETGIKAAMREIKAGGFTGDAAALREAGIKAYFTTEVGKSGKYLAGVAPVQEYGGGDGAPSTGQRQHAYFDQYGVPGSAQAKADPGWGARYNSETGLGYSGPDDMLRVGHPDVAKVQTAAGNKRRDDYFDQYGRPDSAKAFADPGYWDRYNAATGHGAPLDDTLRADHPDVTKIRVAQDKKKQDEYFAKYGKPDSAQASIDPGYWPRYNAATGHGTPEDDTLSVDHAGANKIQNKQLRAQDSAIRDQAYRLTGAAQWDYLHSVYDPALGPETVLEHLNRQTGRTGGTPLEPGRSPDLRGTDNLTDRQRAAYRAEVAALGSYIPAGQPGSTPAGRAAWVAASDRLKAKYGDTGENTGKGGTIDEYVPVGQQRGLPAAGGRPSGGPVVPGQPSSAPPAISPSRPGTSTSPAVVATRQPSSATSAPTAARTSGLAPKSTVTSSIAPVSRGPLPKLSYMSGWSATPSTATRPGSPLSPALSPATAPLEPGPSAKETATAYNAWEARAKAGKADATEAYTILAQHAQGGGDPAPYVRRVKALVYQEIRDYRGATRQASDKQRGAWFAAVKALPETLAGMKTLAGLQRAVRAGSTVKLAA